MQSGDGNSKIVNAEKTNHVKNKNKHCFSHVSSPHQSQNIYAFG
jgi:hypothetical protein